MPAEKTKLNPDTWVEKYGDLFYRYALSRLNDHQAAEDVVQETFLGAIKSVKSFRHSSQEATWMTAILRRKIIDILRKRERSRRNHPESPGLEVSQCSEDQCMDVIGASFAEPPSRPMTDAEFVGTVEQCLKKIPKSLADVFVLRELERVEPDDICKLLGITRKNLWVRLYRARVALGRCIDAKGDCPREQEVDHAK